MSDSLWPHGLQHARLPCPSPSPAVCSNSCPQSQWCHPTISSPATLFSFCLQSFPASGSSPKSWLFMSCGQSFSFSISLSNKYSGLISFGIDWFDLLAAQGTLRNFLQNHILKASFLWPLAFIMVQISHPHITTGKTIALTIWSCISKVMSLLFNMLTVSQLSFQGTSLF